ncbi:LAME_0G14246g1_1 [Lachancea meyersii CBS 8951]|uniref:Leucine carboxyl methyltransferase 1 n=1 Tax=Lachancea meyersii CBS 8951 TaxID=1266667 RepID=A0A1G4KAB6_9SACH|nr:LAME_0G14246g1_1 [Lachancea meyersii CBS 8951]
MDRAVQQTDYDAFSCKISAINKKYLPCQKELEFCEMKGFSELHMAYVHRLKSLNKRAFGKVQRAVQSGLPLMNYGTYLRTVAIDVECKSFLQNAASNSKVQVLNLGCGSDLRMIYFLEQYPHLRWIDLDFAESVSLKAKILRTEEQLKKVVGELRDASETEYVSDRYFLKSCNLNNIEKVLELLTEITDPEVPTLIITECVLCYMDLPKSQALIHKLISLYKSGTWISYDPIGGDDVNDKFGSIMQTNLRESRQLELPTLMVFNSTKKYAQRFEEVSKSTEIETMWQYYVRQVTQEEKNRLKSLQFLDEIEELQLIFSHYVLLKSSW